MQIILKKEKKNIRPIRYDEELNSFFLVMENYIFFDRENQLNQLISFRCKIGKIKGIIIKKIIF